MLNIKSETDLDLPFKFSSLIKHEPISIINDQNFTDYGFLGNGTEANPYRIENYNIASSISFDYGIYIEKTTSYFIIQNCYISHTDNNGIYGIYIRDVMSGSAHIFNNTCINTDIGIYSPLRTKKHEIFNWMEYSN